MSARSTLRFVVAALLAAAVAPVPAGAGTLPWEGSLRIELGAFPPIEIEGGGVATVNGSGGTGHLDTLAVSGGITGSAVVPITDPAATGQGVLSLQGTAIELGAGTLSPLSGGGPLAQDTLPVRGNVLVCVFVSGCQTAVTVPLTVGATRGVGLGGGLVTVSGFAQSGLRISLQGNPWTVGTATLQLTTPDGDQVTSQRPGFVHGPASATSSTAELSGVVQLVTPILVETSLSGFEDLSAFGVYTIRFVPEPTTLLLMGAGVAGLAFVGRRRR